MASAVLEAAQYGFRAQAADELYVAEKVIYRFGVQDGATPEAGFVFGGNSASMAPLSPEMSGNGAVFDHHPEVDAE